MTEKKISKISIIAAIIVPIIGMLIHMLKDHYGIGDIYFPTSCWDDELDYYKQIAAMVSYGAPQGYYGFNESTAAIGTFAAWGIAPLIPYALVGKIFVWNYYTPVITNLVLWIAALVTFVAVLKPDRKQMTWAMAAWLAYSSITRYIFSLTPETIVTICVFFYMLFLVRYIRAGEEEKCWNWLLLANIPMIIVTLLRGYYGILGVPFLYFVLKKKKGLWQLLTQLVLMFGAALMSFWLISKTGAPYYTSNLDLSIFTTVLTAPAAGLKQIAGMIWDGIKGSAGYALEAVHFNSMRGSWYIIYYMVGLWLIYRWVFKRETYMWILIFSHVAAIVALWILYIPLEACRHLIALGFVGFFFMMQVERDNITKGIYVVLVILLTWFSGDTFFGTLHCKDSDTAADIDYGASQFPDPVEFSDDRWENTMDVSAEVYFANLYGIPAGYGINWCQDEYLLRNWGNLMARYLVVQQGSDLESMSQQEGYEEVARYGDLVIFQMY